MADQFPLTRVLARDVPGGSRTKGRLYHLDGAVLKLAGAPAGASGHGARQRPVPRRHRPTRRRIRARRATAPYFTDRLSSASTSGRRCSKRSAAAFCSATATLCRTRDSTPLDQDSPTSTPNSPRASTRGGRRTRQASRAPGSSSSTILAPPHRRAPRARAELRRRAAHLRDRPRRDARRPASWRST